MQTWSQQIISDSNSLPILVFRMGAVRTAFVMDSVMQVFDAVDVGDFPGDLPADVIGLINVRGQKLPLVDIRRRWGLPQGKVQLHNQIVVIDCNGRGLSIIVDEVIGTANIAIGKIVRLDYILGVANAHMAAPFGDGILVLLDPDRLFETEQFERLLAWVDST